LIYKEFEEMRSREEVASYGWHFTFDRINRIYRIKTWKCIGQRNRRGLRTEGVGRRYTK
jgi:hypothetical protein